MLFQIILRTYSTSLMNLENSAVVSGFIFAANGHGMTVKVLESLGRNKALTGIFNTDGRIM
jgi:hypothetical protein